MSAQQADVAGSVRAFTAELYGRLASSADAGNGSRNGSGNIVVSPYSAAAALGMTLEGARGETAAQIGRVLHVAPDDGSAFGGLGTELAGAGRPRPGSRSISPIPCGRSRIWAGSRNS
ncbi:serpin family protein [Microlunatus endophyticus]